tara:strand:- start:7785 stop:8315 length:531 start_codon:yes stop_codon:yes gene_type:complete
MRVSKLSVLILVGSLVLQGCATTGAGGTSTAMDRAVGKCAFAMIGGALLGAAIGSRVGNGNAAEGAGVGILVGGAACAVFVKLAKEDQARISAIEHQAVVENRTRSEAFIAKNGSRVELQTQVRSAPVPQSGNADKPQYTACRYSDKTISVQGQSANVEPQLWCRLETGDWQAVSQ